MYLKDGIITNSKYHSSYTLERNSKSDHRYSIKTNGRYYTFTPLKGGKNITIDIGFNFLERLKHANWYKPENYN
jgi:hypothetical protein